MKKIIFASSIAGASIILSFFSLFSKGIGFFREMIYANKFGISSDYDLFLSSTALITVLLTVFIFFTQHYFIPIFNKVRLESEYKGEEFLNYTFWWSIIIGIVLSLFLLLLSKPILFFYLSGVESSRMERALKYFWIFLLTIPFNNGISVISAYLQAKFSFIYPAVCQIVINIIIISLVFFFSDKAQIIILPISITIAYIIGFILILKPIHIIKFPKWGKIFRYEFAFIHKGNLLNLFIIEFVSLSYILVDRFFINKVPAGSLSAMNYAAVLFALPVSIFSIPLVTTLFSSFSRDHVENIEKLESNFFLSLKVNHFVIILITSIMFIWGDVFFKLFYERGAFDSHSTAITHEVLKYYLIGLLFYSGYLIQVKLFYSIDRYKFVMWLSVIAFFIKISFNVLLVEKYKQNGLAFSTSIVYIFLFIGASFILNRNIFGKNKPSVIHISVYYLLNAVISGFISYVLTGLIIRNDSIFKSLLELSTFTFIYLFNIYLMKGEEITKISAPLFRFTRTRFSQS